MRNFFFRSLRNSLITLVLLAVLPALGVILHGSLENRSRAIRAAEAETLRVVQFLAREQQLITMRAEQLLSLLAEMPQVRAMDGPGATSILRRLKARSQVFAYIVAADAQGRVFASSQPYGPPILLKGSKHYSQALEGGEFSVGEYDLGAQGRSPEPLIHFAQPILGIDGQAVGVLITALRADRYERLFNVASLPEGSVLSIADAKGTRIYRYPEAEDTSPTGSKIITDLWEVISGHEQLGTASVTQADGVRRIVAFTQLRLQPGTAPYLYISVGIPEKQALAEAVATLQRDLMLLFGAAALAILVAWVVGGIVISRPLEGLAGVARRLADGDLDARSGSPDEFGELAVLAKTLDDLAEALSDDIAAREAVEEELRKGEAVLRMILDALPVGVWMVDPGGGIRYANGASRRLWNGADIGARPCETLQAWFPGTGDPLPQNEFVLARALASEPAPQSQVLEIKDQRSAERITVSCAAIPIRGDEDELRAIIVVMEDITERTQREQARESVEHIMRHDLRSPLIGFASLPQLLLHQQNLTEEQRAWVMRMQNSANSMLRIVDAYLKLSRIERGVMDLKVAPVDLLALARSVVRSLEHLQRLRAGHVSVTLGGSPPEPGAVLELECEETLCATMLSNLVKNALEASPEGGIVEVDLRGDDGGVRIAVRNQGEVPASIRPRFFEKYVTSGKRNGTGLGTYSAWRIARFHGGAVELDSSEPGRTTVTVRLPKGQAGQAGRNRA